MHARVTEAFMLVLVLVCPFLFQGGRVPWLVLVSPVQAGRSVALHGRKAAVG